jgi:hypothetical protein
MWTTVGPLGEPAREHEHVKDRRGDRGADEDSPVSLSERVRLPDHRET